MVCTPMANATMAGQPVRFDPAHREFNDTPVVLHVDVSVPLSLEDITAALWIVVRGGMPMSEVFASPERTHAFVLETLLGDGGCDISSALVDLEGIRPGSVEHSVVCDLRERAAVLYGNTQASTLAVRGTRQLAGVS